jgi:hypothetical protein
MLDNDKNEIPDKIKIKRIEKIEEILNDDLHILSKNRGNDYVSRKIKQRLALKNTYFYLYKVDDDLVGCFWTIRGSYVTPYYVPVSKNDAVLFDVEIFPEFRGQGLSLILTEYISYLLRNEGVVRIYISVANWNKASLRWVAKIKFLTYGEARKFKIFGITLTRWYKSK